MERASTHLPSTGPADIPSGKIPKPSGRSSWEIPPGFHDTCGSNDVSLFSSSLPVLRHEKLSLADADQDAHSLENALPNANHLGKDAKGKGAFEDLDVQAIGNLLPDDEDDLLAGITDDFDLSGLPSQVEDLDEDDVFGTGGGLEMDNDPREYLSVGLARANINDSYMGNGAAQYSHPVGTIVGEHPYGEHPSRTLFVRNINSNVEDSELRSLFEQYGDIRTLYTACKHRGFVMISYYDIRDARTAMRALQNKPLRRRKLDIHFSIPKENPSDKDINQGTLVVFNLDPSVSNDDLRQIFGAYGEVKEIRETPHKRHHKFVEFYDVRAAEAALRALNRSDIAGKRIKLEPSRPGGARRNLMQQLNQDLEQDESRSFRHQVGSPIGSSPPGIWAQFSNPADNNSLQSLHQTSTVGAVNSLPNKSSPGLASILPSLSNSVRIPPIGKDHGRSSYLDRAFGYGTSPHGITSQQSHSFPEKSNAVLANLGSSPGTMSSFGHSTTGSSGVGTLTGPQFLWGSPTSDQAHSSGWKASSSLGHSFTSNGQRQGFPHSTHDSSYIAASQPYLGHHVGSAPSGIPFERHFSYFPESADAAFMNPLTYGVGFSQNEGSLLMNMHARGTMNAGTAMRGQMSETSSPGFRMMPSQRMNHMVLGSSAYPIPAFALESERARNRRLENNASQFDGKKQYQLDLDKIKSGEDTRTTLMIKNIPNKYTAKMLLAAIDEKHKGTYDFFYLPIDFKNKCNVGYAFINMVSASHIIPFYQAFNGKKWDKFNSEKVASLAYARIQGKAALVSHFQNSSLMNEDKRCRPILFHYEGPEAGDLEPFPLTLNNINFEVRQQDGPLSAETSVSPPDNSNKNKEKLEQVGSSSGER